MGLEWHPRQFVFQTNNAGIMDVSLSGRHIRPVDAAEIVEIAKILVG
jgi:hypothetical protein